MATAPDGGRNFALINEPGTGKTMIAICNAAWLYMKGRADGMLVIAPRGAHTNWVKDEFPKHCPVPYYPFLWSSGRAKTRGFMDDWQEFLAAMGTFKVFAVNVDALRIKAAKKLIRQFVTSHRCVGVVDESADIASPSAARGRSTRSLSKFLPYRRILDGTPWAESPFELYGQFGFLRRSILGVHTYAEMKAEYGEWEHVEFRSPDKIDPDTGNPRTYPVLKGYRNLDLLAKRIAPYSFIATKAEVLPFLPERTYRKWYFDLSDEARAAYDNLRNEYLHEFADGYEVEAAHVLTRYLRLQQITAGYVPAKAYNLVPESLGYDPRAREIPEVSVDPEHPLPGVNQRLAALIESLKHYRGPAIVWCRFQFDQRLINLTLSALDYSVGWYRGSDAQRESVKNGFQSGEYDIFLADPTSGGRALTLTRAEHMVFYTHYYGLRKRLQAEDRNHRIGLMHNVTVIDLVAEDTIDEKIVASHLAKKSLSDMMGKSVRLQEWL